MTLDDKVNSLNGNLGEAREAFRKRNEHLADNEYQRLEEDVTEKIGGYISKQNKRIGKATRKAEKELQELDEGPGLVSRLTGSAVKWGLILAMGAGIGYMSADMIPKTSYEVQAGDGIYRVATELDVPSEQVEEALYEKRGEGAYLHPEDNVRRYFSGNVRLE